MKYDVLLSGKNEKILNRIKEGSVVLEFGPGNGNMTKYLHEVKKCTVYIIEKDSEAFSAAFQYSANGLCTDIMKLEWVKHFEGIQFDYIILSDVLEHLPDPDLIIQNTQGLLSNSGEIIISIPNITHNDVLINMYYDNFHYTKEGLLDKTHVHFWGHNDLKDFLCSNGYSIIWEDYTFIKTFQTEQKFVSKIVDNDFMHALLKRPYGEIYQFIISARKVTSDIGKDKVDYHKKPLIEVYQTKFYLDYGKGYNENDVISIYNSASSQREIKMSYHCELKHKINRFRIDPVEGVFCAVKNIFVSSDAGNIGFNTHNGVQINQVIYFNNTDSQILFETEMGISFLNIELEIVPLTSEAEKMLLFDVIAEHSRGQDSQIS